MNEPPKSASPVFAVGAPHRALRALELLSFEYDALGVQLGVLPEGALFQPWAPLPHWLGERIPITLGDGAKGFDWGVTSPIGHFLHWDDFFARCCAVGTEAAPVISRLQERPPVSPFAELMALGSRLRADANSAAARERIDALLRLLTDIAAEHAHAADMQRGAEGYDNSESAARYSAQQEQLLRAADALLAAARLLASS